MDLFSLPALAIYAFFLGVTMKIADLLDEHGLKWFPGDKLLFGFLWGFFGVLLVLSRIDIANILLARILAYIPRKRLDYFNHVLAAVMIFIAFAWKFPFNQLIFLSFFFTFLVFGFLRDYYGNHRGKKDFLYAVNEPGLYYLVATLIYGIVVRDYAAFLVFTVMQLSYNAVKYGFYYAGWSREI